MKLSELSAMHPGKNIQAFRMKRGGNVFLGGLVCGCNGSVTVDADTGAVIDAPDKCLIGTDRDIFADG